MPVLVASTKVQQLHVVQTRDVNDSRPKRSAGGGRQPSAQHEWKWRIVVRGQRLWLLDVEAHTRISGGRGRYTSATYPHLPPPLHLLFIARYRRPPTVDR